MNTGADFDQLSTMTEQQLRDYARQLERERDARLVAALKEPRPTAAAAVPAGGDAEQSALSEKSREQS